MAETIPPARELGKRPGRNRRRKAAASDGPAHTPQPVQTGTSTGATRPGDRPSAERPAIERAATERGATERSARPASKPRGPRTKGQAGKAAKGRNQHAGKGAGPSATEVVPGQSSAAVSPPPITNSTPAAARVVAATAPAGGAPTNGATGHHHRQAYAAIDLGTNNCRLLIARPSGENFVVIDAFSRVVRLGEGLAQSGRLSDAAMDRALAALHICADKLRKRTVHLARSVATEACRRASNGAEFIARVHRETGIRLDIITAQEEARLAVLGCHILLEHGEGLAMIFDIGGGSTEMVLVDPTGGVPRILDWQSVPWGVVSLTESIGNIGSSAEERLAAYAEMRRRVASDFAAFAGRVAPLREEAQSSGAMRLMGTSGTVTTLASLYLELPQYDRRAIDGVIVPTEAMRGISQRLSRLSPAERMALPCIGRERSDLVVAGCAILETIFDIWPAPRLGIADRGIREGILRSLMASGAAPDRSAAALRAAAARGTTARAMAPR